MESACLRAGGVLFRVFFGRAGDMPLRLEVEEERLSRELEPRVEYFEIEDLLLSLRGVEGFLRGVAGLCEECRKSERTRLELKEVSCSNSNARDIF